MKFPLRFGRSFRVIFIQQTTSERDYGFSGDRPIPEDTREGEKQDVLVAYFFKVK